MLFSMKEIQEILKYLNRAPLGFAEQLFAQEFFEKLIAFCQPPKVEETDALAIADALDKIDEDIDGE